VAPLKALIGEHAKGPQKFLKVPQNAKKAPAISFEPSVAFLTCSANFSAALNASALLETSSPIRISLAAVLIGIATETATVAAAVIVRIFFTFFLPVRAASAHDHG
jgi:hypothetical protein